MSESKHTPEPWEFGYGQTREFGMCLGIGLNSAPDWHVVAVVSPADSVNHADEANARRIVACVNACAGIPDEQLYDQEPGCLLSAMVEQEQEIMTITKQRDELLKAAEAIEINAEECLDFEECTAMLVQIDDYHKLMEAIASVKEK